LTLLEFFLKTVHKFKILAIKVQLQYTYEPFAVTLQCFEERLKPFFRISKDEQEKMTTPIVSASGEREKNEYS
jgi:hypothetical protein